MSDRDPQQLVEEAVAQLAEARRRPIPDEARLRLRARLAAETGALASPPGSAPLAPARALPWGRLAASGLVIFGAGIAVGLIGGGSLNRRLPAQLVAVPIGDQRSEPPASVAVAMARVSAVADVPSLVEIVPPVDDGAGSRRSSRSGGGRDTGLASERAILEIARTAIARRDNRTALEALERHAREFPRGRLEEERESLLVQAFIQAGRATEARDRAARFRRRFPDSLLLPAVEAAVAAAAARK